MRIGLRDQGRIGIHGSQVTSASHAELLALRIANAKLRFHRAVLLWLVTAIVVVRVWGWMWV